MSSLNLVRGEHTGLSLAVSIAPLLKQFLDGNEALQLLQTIPHNYKSITEFLFRDLLLKLNFVTGFIDDSLARLFCGHANSGSAILIDREKAIFLTASHVVSQVIYIFF